MGALARLPGGGAKGGLSVAVAVVTGLLALNLAFTVQPMQSARTLALFAAYALVFIYCRGLTARGSSQDAGEFLPSSSRFGPIEGALIGAGSGLAADGLYQSLHAFGRIAQEAGGGLPEAVRARIESGRAVATLGLPGALGGLLAMTLPITIGWTLVGRSGAARKAAGAALILLQAVGLAATRSAAPVVCLAAAAALVSWWGGPGPSRRVPRRATAVALLAIGVVAGALLLAARLSGPAAAVEGSGPLALRLGNWKVAWRILADHPLAGAGLGCYGIVFPGYRAWGMNESRFAHNSYLQLVAEGGLPLGLIALVACAVALRLLHSTCRGPHGARPATPYHVTACLAFLLHNAFDFTLYLPTVGFAFFALAGLAVPSARAGIGAGRVAGARPLVAIASLALAAFAVWTARTDAAKEAARAMLEEGAPAEEPVRAARAAARLNPFDPDAASLLSRVLVECAIRHGEDSLLVEAELAAESAVRLDPLTPRHWNHLGRVRLQRKDPLGAYVALHRAAELYPIQISYREDRDALGAALAREGGR